MSHLEIMGIMDFFARRDKFTEEEVTLLSQHDVLVHDTLFSAVVVLSERPEYSSSKSIEKYQGFFVCRLHVNVIFTISMLDAETMHTGTSEKFTSFEDALTFMKDR